MPAAAVPELRITAANDCSVRGDGDHVLYWMIAARRAQYNFGLDRAIEHARELGKPLIVLEALRTGYRWASDRLHAFVLTGMRDNVDAFADSPVRYYPYVEPDDGAGSGLLEELAKAACVVVTDDFPCFFLPRMVAAAAEKLSCRLEKVDSNGLLPVAAPGEKVFSRAVDLRRWLQKNLAPHLDETPKARPLARLDLPQAHVPQPILDRWPEATKALLAGDRDELAELPIDHDIAPVAGITGGAVNGRRHMRTFLDDHLGSYDDDRNHPDKGGGSGLSPWLHFGHVSAHELFHELTKREDWSTDDLGDQRRGGRDGFWKMSAPAEAFLDEFVTWRELGFNFCARVPDYDEYGSLPDWARKTLREHGGDPRPHVYSIGEFDNAETHDPIWNAAQRQLRREGRIHNYLRMLWGKKVLHWTETPQIAAEILIELNNRYALDGRDPNSYSGIFWVLGRFDRAWGPEREVFGKVRYMASDRTKAKIRMKEYLEEFGAES